MTMASSVVQNTLGIDFTKMSFQSCIDEDSGEQDSSTGSDPKEVARILESKLTMKHKSNINQILFEADSKARYLFKENLYLDDTEERLRKYYKDRS